MYRRTLWRIPLRSIAESFCKPTHGRRSFTDNYPACTTSIISNASLEVLGIGRELPTKSAQLQIVDALRSGERRKASNLLLDFARANYSLEADDFVYILGYCAKSPDPLFVIETWRIMVEREICLSGKSLLLMMQSFCVGGYLAEASQLIQFIGKNYHFSSILPLYNSFLGACVKYKSMVHANECLDLMESQNVGKDEETYSELLKLAVWQENLSAAHDIWNDYTKHYSMSLIYLKRFVWAFTILGDLKSAYETLQHMVGLAVRGKIFIKKDSEGKLCSSRLDIPIPLNGEIDLQEIERNGARHLAVTRRDPAHAVEQSMVSKIQDREVENAGLDLPNKLTNSLSRRVLRLSFNDVLHACAQAQDCELADQLMKQMEDLGLQPSSKTYNGFVKAIVSIRGYGSGIEVLKIMQQKNLKPLEATFATIAMACSSALQLDLAETLLDQISQSTDPRPFNYLLAACDAMDQPERAVRILEKIRQLKIQPNIFTYELLFSLFGNVNAPYEEGNTLSQRDSAKRIKAIEMDMAKNGVQHSQRSMINLLKALGEEGMVREMIGYLQVAESLFSQKHLYLAPIYNAVLHLLVEAKESDMAIEIFRSIRSYGVPLDAGTYNIMIDCCSVTSSIKTALALVSMMIRDGYNPGIETYTTLFKILLKDEKFDDVFDLLDQANSEKIQPDVRAYNTILYEACEKGRLDVIELVIEQMHREKVQPNPSTCEFAFAAYVKRGFHNTAMEALQVLSMRMLCEEDGTLEEKKTEFEDEFILSEDSEVESRILFFFKDYKENVTAALLNLRWCALLGYLPTWSPNQSLWAKRLSANYDARKED